MNNITNFIKKYYDDALKLVKAFDKTKEKKWDEQIYLNELYVQLGHVYNVLNNDKYVSEKNRKIDNLGDELSDVILQLINLSSILNINLKEFKKQEITNYTKIDALPIFLGQLTEAIMEENNFRFKKERYGFENRKDFIKNRIFNMLIITFNIAQKYQLNMNKEFEAMLIDANNFLKKY